MRATSKRKDTSCFLQEGQVVGGTEELKLKFTTRWASEPGVSEGPQRTQQHHRQNRLL